MNDPSNAPPSLSNTLLLGGGCVLLGLFSLLVGLGVIPSATDAAGGRLMASGAGALFIFAGLMVIVRDFAGARNNEELPASAPVFLHLSAGLLNIFLLATFATIASAIALGIFPDLQRQLGSVAVVFRLFMGAFALLLWYGVIYLAYTKVKPRSGTGSNKEGGNS